MAKALWAGKQHVALSIVEMPPASDQSSSLRGKVGMGAFGTKRIKGLLRCLLFPKDTQTSPDQLKTKQTNQNPETNQPTKIHH